MKRLALLAVLACVPLHAATLTPATCSLANVQNAYNSANDGDTVAIPAGTCTWNATLTIAKGVSLVGAGIGATTLPGARFTVTVPDGKAWRVSGFTTSGTAGFNLTGASKQWRIDHIKFQSVDGWTQGRIVWIQPANGSYTAGVIDHADFQSPQSIQVHIREGANGSYQRPLDLGGADAIYVEDSTFFHSTLNISAPVTDCEGGGRLVFRHNVVTNAYLEMHDAIIGGLRSCRKWEFYDNTFKTTGAQGQYVFVAIRGGTGVVYNNTFEQLPDGPAIIVDLYRTYQTDGDPWGAICKNTTGKACLNGSTNPQSCSSDSTCGGTGSCIAIDGASSSPSGYPCRDQFGFSGNAPQTLAPALFWNNKFGGVSQSPDINSGQSYILLNRDYCVSATTKPTACNGVTTTYNAYAYPHPVAGGTAPPPPPPTQAPPNPPTNVSVS